jgi:biopolymer transport protein ExbB
MTAIDVMSMLLAQTDLDQPRSTWWDTIQSGGLVGYIIIGLSVVALALIIMHLVQIRRAALIPPEQLDELDQLLNQGNPAGALDRCYQPGSDSYLTRIMAAGLTRYQKSAFGAFEIKNAIEEAGEDQTARLYRSTDALGVIGSIAPLLGLLGTVLGMVGAFETLSRTATPNHEELAANISLALVTTLMGLVLAIPCIALHRYFGNRIDALASEAAMEIERLVLHLESTGSARPTGGLPPRPGPISPIVRPEPQPAPPVPAPKKPPAGKEPS